MAAVSPQETAEHTEKLVQQGKLTLRYQKKEGEEKTNVYEYNLQLNEKKSLSANFWASFHEGKLYKLTLKVFPMLGLKELSDFLNEKYGSPSFVLNPSSEKKKGLIKFGAMADTKIYVWMMKGKGIKLFQQEDIFISEPLPAGQIEFFDLQTEIDTQRGIERQDSLSRVELRNKAQETKEDFK